MKPAILIPLLLFPGLTGLAAEPLSPRPNIITVFIVNCSMIFCESRLLNITKIVPFFKGLNLCNMFSKFEIIENFIDDF